MENKALLASLAKKKIDPFHTAVLGFTIGSLVDRGVTEEEVLALCAFLVGKISAIKDNPEALASLEKFGAAMSSAAESH